MILMRKILNKSVTGRVTFLAGDAQLLEASCTAPVKEPFDDGVVEFLDRLSLALRSQPQIRQYPELAAFAFWIRRNSLYRMKQQYGKQDTGMRLGRGLAFHIAPSNVPVNFAYSLAAGLLTGNSNVVRVPSADFPQAGMIAEAVRTVLKRQPDMGAYVILIRYPREKDINDALSAMADIRVIWGGDDTVARLRASPLPPGSTEIVFPDRYSLAVLDADAYLRTDDKAAVARRFYNDTYFTDQNACTSPRIVIWLGDCRHAAKKRFWDELYRIVKTSYQFRDIRAVDKLEAGYLLAAEHPGIKIIPHPDNLLIRVQTEVLTGNLMKDKGNSGFFLEYDCDDIMELRPLCDDARCQTIGFLGGTKKLSELLRCGVRGVSRIVPVGKTMDFGLVWDGYDLIPHMTRAIWIQE